MSSLMMPNLRTQRYMKCLAFMFSQIVILVRKLRNGGELTFLQNLLIFHSITCRWYASENVNKRKTAPTDTFIVGWIGPLQRKKGSPLNLAFSVNLEQFVCSMTPAKGQPGSTFKQVLPRGNIQTIFAAAFIPFNEIIQIMSRSKLRIMVSGYQIVITFFSNPM